MPAPHKKKAFKTAVDNMFQRLSGQANGIVDLDEVDMDLMFAFTAGDVALRASEDASAAMLAIVLNADLGKDKREVIEGLKAHGVDEKVIQSVFFHAGKPIDYHTLWKPKTREALLDNFAKMPEVARTAIMAHVIKSVDKIDEGPTRAPKKKREDLLKTAREILPLAQQSNNVLIEELSRRLYPRAHAQRKDF